MRRIVLRLVRRILVSLRYVALILFASWLAPGRVSAQAPDSATVAAGARYQAGALHRWIIGDTYRDLWVTPVRVPVLHLSTFAGGLKPTKAGGGLQTKSLRFDAANGAEYVFRLSDKSVNSGPKILKDTPADRIFQDQVSAMHPAASPISAAMLEPLGVLHPTARLMLMADDPLLGEFRKEFGGKYGMIEEYPSVPDKGAGFAGASKIIDSEDLLKLLNADATQRVNARAFLRARLADYLINDTDRHPGNWKWARLSKDPAAPWEPIARDRDHALVAFDGWFIDMVRKFAPKMVSLQDPPRDIGMTQSKAFDARMLASLDRPVWDSITASIVRVMTDSTIAAAIRVMPAEYYPSAPALERELRKRRDALPEASARYYRLLANRVEVHGTDSADQATITRVRDNIVKVQLTSAGRTTYTRDFDASETDEILVYLLNGDDSARVLGTVGSSILVRVVGGNGHNVLRDSSRVSGEARLTRLYDNGNVSGVSYGLDTLFDRRPWERKHGVLAPPEPDVGVSIQPVAGVSFHRRIGLTPRVGLMRTVYGFRARPYSSMVKLTGEYAARFDGYRVTLVADKRLESSPLHGMLNARMSDIEVVNFNGIGNATIDSGATSRYFEVRQRQWLLNPAVAVAIGTRLDVALGPVFQHSVTDDVPGRFLTQLQPYGVGRFDQAALQLLATYEWQDSRKDVEHTHHRVMATASAAYFPAMLDVTSAFSKYTVRAGTSISVPVPLRPLFVLRAGAEKLTGTYPFHEAATIGGQGTTRYMDTQRYSGDAAVYASSELRVPIARFHLLIPVRFGVLGLAEAGRVYDKGQSPGGWYSRTGQGLWFGRGDSSPVLTITRTTEPNHPGFHVRLGLNF